jgi:hypothetical protein
VAENDWVRQLAEVERQRGATAESFRSALKPFMEALFRNIRNDLSVYYSEFSEDTNFIEEGTTSEGRHFIRKSVRSDNRFIGVIPAVEFAFELTDMVLVCRFHHVTHLDREFPLILNDDGHMAVPGMSMEDLSKYLLAPVLFDTICACPLR